MFRNKTVSYVFFLGLFLLSPQKAISQGILEVFGQLKSELPNLRSAEIKISEDNGVFQEIKFNGRSGKFDLALPIGHVFTFEFSHLGCITKQIEISTICPESYNETIFDPFYFSVSLETYSEAPSIDTLFYDRPVGKVYFTEEYEKFGYDREYILFVQNAIQEAVENQLMASIKRDQQTEALLASSSSLQNLDSLSISDISMIANFSPDSVQASIRDIKEIQSDSIPDSDQSLEPVTFLAENSADEEISIADNTNPTKETLALSGNNFKSSQVETEIIPSESNTENTRLEPAIKNIEENKEGSEPDIKIKPVEKPDYKETVKKVRPPENRIEQEPDRPVRPMQNEIQQEPERLVRPKETNYTEIPQFKKRPERKSFENTQYSAGLWTRIFINEGSRVTKYTMIQYNSGKTSYYKQEQFQTDSLQISRSIFMRVIK